MRRKYIVCSAKPILRSNQNLDQAQHYFSKGLKIAREQKAKSLELKLCLSMCDLSRSEKDADKCRTQLGEIYRSFSEGFDTADLVRAKARLENTIYIFSPISPSVVGKQILLHNEICELSIDCLQNVFSVVRHQKMRTFAHVVGEPTACELAPASGVFFRNPRVRVADETADREGKWLDRLILIIVGHSKLGADCGQQHLPQLRYLQHPVGGRSIELPDDIREDFVGLGVKGEFLCRTRRAASCRRQGCLRTPPCASTDAGAVRHRQMRA